MAVGGISKEVSYRFGGQLYDCRADALRAWRVMTICEMMRQSPRFPGEVTPAAMEQMAAWALTNYDAIAEIATEVPDVEGEDQ